MRRWMLELTMGCVLGAAALFSCCGLNADATEAAAREGLNLLADTVAPASQLASLGCDAKKRLVPAEIKAGAYSTVVGDARLADIRTRCTALEDTFNTIRGLQDQAATAVEQGKMQEALMRLDQARQHFRSLQPMLEEP